jgi:hemerythrin
MLEAKAEVDGVKHPSDVRAILEALTSYSKYHFLSEERIMFERNFPHLDQQRVDHKWFVDRLNEIVAAYRSDDSVFNHDLFEYLRGWFFDHILAKDILLRDYRNTERVGG